MSKYSSTGINSLKHDSPKHSLLFSDNICPLCGNELMLDQMHLKGELVNIRFICKKCNFICPIHHNNDSSLLIPIYDSSISDFIDNFGETIDDNRIRMLKET